MDVSLEFKFKTLDVGQRARLLHPLLIDIMADMYQWAVDNSLPFEVTATVSTAAEDAALNRVSDAHLERRAFDLSIQGWTEDKIKEFTDHFNFKYADVAAIGGTSGRPVLVLYHNSGHGNHIHVQIHKRYAFTANA